MKSRNYLVFYLNGDRVLIEGSSGGIMMADYLRSEKNLPGTKIVCAEGDCGACTVLRLFPLGSTSQKKIFLPINSCITPLAQMDGCSVITVEALAEKKLTVVQESLKKCHASQCGFCTPGFVMAVTGLCEKKTTAKALSPISDADAKNALTGNLCRCTGYQSIIDSAKNIELQKYESLMKRFYTKNIKADLRKHLQMPILISEEKFQYAAPINLKGVIATLNKSNSTLIAGATDLGVVHNKRKLELHDTLSLHLISKLYEISKTKPNRLSVGARVTLADLRHYLKGIIPEFSKFLDLFASPQIKNVATLIGNVATASPIADTPPFLLLMNTHVEIYGPKGKRWVKLENFFLKYRVTDLGPNEIITSLVFDIPNKAETLVLYKVSQRKDMDISAVNFAARLEWESPRKAKIRKIKIALGGVAATTIRLYKTEQRLTQTEFSPKAIASAIECLHLEISPLSDLRGSKAFRHVIAENLLKRFFSENVS